MTANIEYGKKIKLSYYFINNKKRNNKHNIFKKCLKAVCEIFLAKISEIARKEFGNHLHSLKAFVIL